MLLNQEEEQTLLPSLLSQVSVTRSANITVFVCGTNMELMVYKMKHMS